VRKQDRRRTKIKEKNKNKIQLKNTKFKPSSRVGSVLKSNLKIVFSNSLIVKLKHENYLPVKYAK
jgi:hypothetical protein